LEFLKNSSLLQGSVSILKGTFYPHTI